MLVRCGGIDSGSPEVVSALDDCGIPASSQAIITLNTSWLGDNLLT